MTEPGDSASPFSLCMVWTQNLTTPLRQFLRTETGSAAVLLAATLAALAWANIDPSGYAATWHTELVIRVRMKGLADSWQGWVNSGLMAFFLVAGLEARREFDMGELREQRRLTLPLVVALGGMVVPIAIYLAVNFGRSSAPGWRGHVHGQRCAWRAGPGRPRRTRPAAHLPAHVALSMTWRGSWSSRWSIAATSTWLRWVWAWPSRRGGGRTPAGCLQRCGLCGAGGAAWIRSLVCVDPVVVGLVIGLLRSPTLRARRSGAASESFRLFASSRPGTGPRRAGKRADGDPPNDRLQQLFHPWTSYLIVPLFALANAGITVSGSFSPALLPHRDARALARLRGRQAAGTVGAAWLLAGSAAVRSARRSAGPRSRRRSHRGIGFIVSR